jgi:glucose-6-phosphate 1-dehydrogenase
VTDDTQGAGSRNLKPPMAPPDGIEPHMTTDPTPLAQERRGDPCAFVIFGASGDLAKRKLLPALLNLRLHGLLPTDFAVVGVARRDTDQEKFRAQMTEDIRRFATQRIEDAIWSEIRERIYFCRGDFDVPETYERLRETLGSLGQAHRTGGNCLFYLATPPEYFVPIIRNLGATGLATEDGVSWRRVVVEKPFGHDLDSARRMNQEIREVLHERQVYRIDHYLGKETVQNLMVFRFGNGIFEPVWNRRYIDHVQITVAETVGVEGRGGYYEQAGALRDVMQNHMFLLLALMAMESPSSFKGDAVRNEKVKVLEAIRPMQPEEVLQHTVRGQYGPGSVAGQAVPAYRSEPRVAPASTTETYAALRLCIENWRWADVPFYLRSGKRLPLRSTEIVVQFRRPPLLLFGKMPSDQIGPNRIILHLQPNEGITLEIMAKTPGPTIRTQTVKLDFNYRDFGSQNAATGYERLLYDCMVGDSTLFHRTDLVETAWKVATPILDVWRSLPPRDFPNYTSGTWGPAAADALLQRDGRHWWNPA